MADPLRIRVVSDLHVDAAPARPAATTVLVVADEALDRDDLALMRIGRELLNAT